jgi:predicted glycosyltransferase
MTERQIKKYDIFRYSFKKEETQWCRHGILVAHYKKDGVWMLNDTYWGKFAPDSSYGWHREDEVRDRIKYFGNVKHIREISSREANHYEDKDILHIPIGGGSEGWFVRTSAKANISYMIGQLHEEVERERRNINWAIKAIVEKEIEIKQLSELEKGATND